MDASHDAGSALVDTVFVGLTIVIIIVFFIHSNSNYYDNCHIS